MLMFNPFLPFVNIRKSFVSIRETTVWCVVFVWFAYFGVLSANANNFTTDYNVTYDVSETGKARVTQDIILTNHTATLYPSDYTLTVRGGEIENVSASDELGQMKINVTKLESESAIKVSFNKKTIGQGSKVGWKLSYDVPGFAVRRGRIWELTVPKIERSTDIGGYTVSLQVPKSFGPEHFVSPQPDSTEHNQTSWVYYFNQPSSRPTVISAAFGDFQLFSFKLKYHLQNPESFAATTEIALLPDLFHYQRIYYQNLEPKPQKIYQDGDGNYLASYKLAAKEKLDIVFEGMAEVVGNVVDVVDVVDVEKQQPPNSLQPYLLPAKYWEVNAEEIQKLLKEIIESNNNLAMKQFNNENNCSIVPLPHCYEEQGLARIVYDYVITNLSYDPTRINEEVERLGAVQALEHKDSAVCMEFTDLLITLMRAGGIPAREIDGYAYTSEDEDEAATSDTLHSWVQIYPVRKETELSSGVNLPDYGWLNIDPTWGATTGIDYFTKLDTNHLAFVIKGIDSERPYPAGSYKVEGSEEEDVQVSFTEKFIDPARRSLDEGGNVIPFRLWWENWERENKKVDWLTTLFRLLVRFF